MWFCQIESCSKILLSQIIEIQKSSKSLPVLQLQSSVGLRQCCAVFYMFKEVVVFCCQCLTVLYHVGSYTASLTGSRRSTPTTSGSTTTDAASWRTRSWSSTGARRRWLSWAAAITRSPSARARRSERPSLHATHCHSLCVKLTQIRFINNISVVFASLRLLLKF